MYITERIVKTSVCDADMTKRRSLLFIVPLRWRRQLWGTLWALGLVPPSTFNCFIFRSLQSGTSSDILFHRCKKRSTNIKRR